MFVLNFCCGSFFQHIGTTSLHPLSNDRDTSRECLRDKENEYDGRRRQPRDPIQCKSFSTTMKNWVFFSDPLSNFELGYRVATFQSLPPANKLYSPLLALVSRNRLVRKRFQIIASYIAQSVSPGTGFIHLKDNRPNA